MSMVTLVRSRRRPTTRCSLPLSLLSEVSESATWLMPKSGSSFSSVPFLLLMAESRLYVLLLGSSVINDVKAKFR